MRLLCLLCSLLVCRGVFAQANNDALVQQQAYRDVLNKRVAKFLQPIGIQDSAKYHSALNVIVGQYVSINDIQDGVKKKEADIKNTTKTKEEKQTAIATLDQNKKEQLSALHQKFLDTLSRYLTAGQIDNVKDGMTYGVAPKTYEAYVEMIPALTAQQKDQIHQWLYEARELAMDEGSSEKKHAVFGKYKGRINNYLSAQGYDVKKEGEAWQKRIEQQKNASK